MKTLITGLLLLCSFFISLGAGAAAITWTGSTSTDWATASNWSGGALPTSADDVTIPTTPSGGRMPAFSSGTVTLRTLTVQTGATLTVSGGTLNVTGGVTPCVNINAGGTLSQSGGTLSFTGGSVSIYGTFNQSGGTYLTSQTLNVYGGGIINQSGIAVMHMATATGTAPTENIVVASNGTIIQSGGTFNVRDITLAAGPPVATFTQTGGLFRLYHDLINNGTFTASGGTIQFSADAGGATFPSATATNQFYHVVIDAGVDPGFDNAAAASIKVAGNWTNNGSSNILSGRATTVEFNGTAAQSIGGSVSTTFRNVTINNSGNTVTLTANQTINGGDLTISSGTLDLTTYTLNRSANGGTISMAASTYLKTASTFPASFTTGTFNATSTVEFYSSSSQTIPAYNYGHLVSSNTGARVLASSGTIGIAGVFTHGTNSYTTTGSTVEYNGTITQTIHPLNYNNLTSSNTGARVLSSSSTIGIGGTFTVGTNAYTVTGSTVDFNGTGAQTIPGFTFNNFTASGSGTVKTAAGNITVNGTFTINSGVTLGMSTYVLSGTLSSLNGTGTLRTMNTSATPIPTGRTWPYTVEYNAATGGQTVMAGTYANLTNSNTSGANTAEGNLSVTGTLTLNTSSVLGMSTFVLSGTLSTITGTGTLRTRNTSAAPIPTGRTWPGTVEYNNTTGGQTVVTGTYTNLTCSNTSGIQTAEGALSISTALSLGAGSTLDIVTYTLTGAFTTTNALGTVKTSNTSATPLPTGKTWPGTVEYYNATGGQTVMAGTYTNLTNSNTTGTNTASGNISISGTLTLNTACVLDMATYTLSGTLTTISGSGMLKTASTAGTPIPQGKNWPGTVWYYSISTQDIVYGNYTNLDGTGGNRTLKNNGVIGISGTFTTGSGIYATGGTTVDFNGSSAQTIPPLNYINVICSNSSVKTLSTGSAYIESLTISAGATLQQTNGSLLEIKNSPSITGTFTQAGGTLLSENDITISSGGTITISSGLIHMNKLAGSNPNRKIVISSGATMNQSGGTLSEMDLTINAGPPAGVFNQTGGTIKHYDDFINYGTFNATGGTVEFYLLASKGSAFPSTTATNQFYNVVITAGANPEFDKTTTPTIKVAGNWTHNGATTVLSGRATTVEFNGTGNQMIGGSVITDFYHMVVNKPSGTVTLGYEQKIVNGNLTVTAGTLDLSTYPFNRTTAGGTLTVASGARMVLGGNTGGQTGSNFPLNFSTLTLSPTGTVEYNGSNSITQTIYAVPTYGHLTLTNGTGSGSSTKNTTANILVNGNLTINTGAVLSPADANTVGGSGTLTGTGTAQVTRTAATPDFLNQYTLSNRNLSALTVEYSATLAQTVNALNYYNLTVSGARTTNSVTYASSGTIGVSGTFSPNATFTTGGRIITGSTIDFNGTDAQNIPAFTYNNLTFSSTGARTLASSGTIGIAGTFTPGSNAVTATGSTIEFNGSSAQTIPAFAYHNLTSNNSSGASLSGNITVGNTLTLSSGLLTVTAGNTLHITSGNAVGGSSFGASKHIVTAVNTVTGAKGFLRMGSMASSTAYTFPVGNGTHYLPAIVTPSATTSISVSAFQGLTSTGEPNGAAYSAAYKSDMVDAVWNISRNSGSGTMSVSVNWPQTLEGANFSAYTDSQIGIAFHDGSSWGGGFGSGSQSSNTSERTSIAGSGPFNVRYSISNTVLPLRFTHLGVARASAGNKVDWRIANGEEISHYVVEHSANGTHFNAIGMQKAVAYSSAYEYIHSHPENNLTFYRVKGVYKNGKEEYSTVVRIDPSFGNSLVLKTNPVRGKKLQLEIREASAELYHVRLFNEAGMQVYHAQWRHAGGSALKTMQLPSSLTAGVYTLYAEGKNSKLVKQVIIWE